MRIRTVSVALLLVTAVGGCTETATEVSPRITSTPTAEATDTEWAENPDATGHWIAAFFGPDTDEVCGDDLEPVRRWKKVSDVEEDATAEDDLRLALRTLVDAKPKGLWNTLIGKRLDLLGASVNGDRVTFDFDEGIRETSNTGTCGASAYDATFTPTLRHYYPEAKEICLTVNGKSPEDARISVFHDVVTCPFWDASDPTGR